MTTKNRKPKQNKKRISIKTLKGGIIYGEPGTYGITLGDPPLPEKQIKQRYSKQGSRTKKSKPNNNAINGTNENSYVSKIFFDEKNIPLALSAIDYLVNSVAESGSSIEEIFGNHIALPRKWKNNKYYTNIDTQEYTSQKYQKDEYWMFNKPKTPEKNVPQIELRDKVKKAKKQIQYRKAECGDLDSILVNSPAAFIDFMTKYKNIVAGLDILHSYRLAHLDVKLANMLCIYDAENKYVLSDLDTIRPFDYFTMEYFESLDKDDIKLFDLTRFFNNWSYEYFPTCITLLTATLASTDGKINSKMSLNSLSYGLKNEWNKEAAIGCQRMFLLIYKKLKKLQPDTTKNIIENLRHIFWNKYGNHDFNGDFTDATEEQKKYAYLYQFNKVIAEDFNTSNIQPIDIRNILLKYVDIYGASMSIIRKIFQFLYETPEDLITPEIIDYLGNIIQLIKSIMTIDYFRKKLYEQTFLNLFEQIQTPI